MRKRKERNRRQYEQTYHELRLYGEEIYTANNWKPKNDAQDNASLTYDTREEIFTGWINRPRKFKFYDLMASRYPSLWFPF